MPELPEVETVRRGLERFAVGRRVQRVEVGRERTVRRTSREAVIAGLTDTTIMAASAAARAPRISLTKSAYPGVSMMLNSCSCQVSGWTEV